MRPILLLLLMSVLIHSCSTDEGYTMKGKLPKDTDGKVYLQQRINGQYVDIDSSVVVNGKFKITGSVDAPDVYLLSLNKKGRKPLFIENSNYTIIADSGVIADATITGGQVQDLFNSYEAKYNTLYDYMLQEYYKISEEPDEEKKVAMEARVDSIYEGVELYQETFILDHHKSPVAAYVATLIQYGRNANELDDLLHKLDTSLSYTVSYQYLANRVEQLVKLSVGQAAPECTQNDADGNPIAFSSVYSANKLTLVDFWASWCGPCRAENPNVVKAFTQYKNKGFMVFGVSLDSNKDAWLKAIQDDKLTWTQVSDLKGWDNAFSKLYAVNSIPANYLVDQNGIIVGTGLRGEELLAKLDELLNK